MRRHDLPCLRLVLACVLVTACTELPDDAAAFERSPHSAAQQAEIDAGLPPGPVAHDCEALIGGLPVAYQSAVQYGTTRAARASSDGYVVLLLDERTLPSGAGRVHFAKLVHTPAGPVDVDLSALLPSGGMVEALSEIRAGHILIAHGATAPETVSSVDLAQRRVDWSRPLRDPSREPLPAFDTAGEPVTASSPDPGRLAAVGTSGITYLADGGYAVVAETPRSLALFGFDPLGDLRFRANLVPFVQTDLPGRRITAHAALARGAGGRLSVLIEVFPGEQVAFGTLHGVVLGGEPTTRWSLVLTYSQAGERLELQQTPRPFCGGYMLDVKEDELVWSGTCGLTNWIATSRYGQQTPRVTYTSNFNTEQLTSVVFTGGPQRLVAGRTNYRRDQYGVYREPGQAFVAQLGEDGLVQERCLRREPEGSYLVTGRAPLVILNESRTVRLGLVEGNTRARIGAAAWGASRP